MPYLIAFLVMMVYFVIPHFVIPFIHKNSRNNPWYYAAGVLIGLIMLVVMLGVVTSFANVVPLFWGRISIFLWLVYAVSYGLEIPNHTRKTKEK